MLTIATPRRPGLRHAHAGMALMEVLAALFVLALGIAGLVWSQARLLADTRTSMARSTAVIFAEDLANRMMANRGAATQGHYALSWDEQPARRDCSAGCSGRDMARADVADWRATLATALPGGNATVFRSSTDARQIGIAIAWSATEGPAAQDPGYHAPFAVQSASHGVDCPAGQLCHVSYVLP